MATFNETRANAFRKYGSEQGIMMPNWSKTFQNFWSHSSVFNWERLPKNLNFHSVLPLIEPLVATFSETCAPTSRQYVAEEGIVMPNWLKKFQAFCSLSSLLTLANNLKI